MCRTRGVLVVVRGTVDRPGAAGHGTHASTHRRNAFHISVHWHMDMRCKTKQQYSTLDSLTTQQRTENRISVWSYGIDFLT
jgi:hypothetical protein